MAILVVVTLNVVEDIAAAVAAANAAVVAVTVTAADNAPVATAISTVFDVRHLRPLL